MAKIKEIIFIGICFLLISCERVIDLVPENLPPKIVVDGSIESGRPPTIILTKSLNYFNNISASILEESFVRGALITVNDGTRTIKLNEYSFNSGGINFYFYSVDTSNPASIMLGEFGKAYTLQIDVNGEKFSSTTHVPLLSKKIDSLWWEPAPNNPDTNRVVVFARVTDPPGRGNYTRYFTSRNDSAFLAGFNSVFDDAIVDGITYDVQVFRGQNRNEVVDNEEFGYFRRGNKVQIKLSNIDKATYDFWRTWEQNQQNIGNPFGVPIKILSNISNGGLGLWGGYASGVKELKIPD